MRSDYDWSEAEDIYHILSCLGVVEVVDVGCGGGELVQLLRSRGFKAVGCDIAVRSNTSTIFYCDAAKPETVPTAEAWVFQHVLEHIPKESWSQLFARAWKAGVRHIVIVVPGHTANDRSHVCNHFVLNGEEDVRGLFGKVKLCRLSELTEMLKHIGYNVIWFPDTRSIEAPWSLDYIVVASESKHLRLRLLPWIATTSLGYWLLLKFAKRVLRKVFKLL
jgi:SAM-dependent methyltransferase